MLKNLRPNNGILNVFSFGECNIRQKAILQGNQYPSKGIKCIKKSIYL